MRHDLLFLNEVVEIRTIPHPLTLIAASILFTPGCESPRGSDDFAGAPQWSADLEWSFGSVDDPRTVLSRIGSLAVSDDQTVYAWLASEAAVLSLDSLGRPGPRVGRQGEGPGEFSRLVRIGTVGDTLYTLDMGLSRISYFDPSGDLIRTVQVGPPNVPEGYFSGPLLALLPDETAAMSLSYPAHLLAEGRIQDTPVLRIDKEGRTVATLAEISQERIQVTIDLGERGPFFTGQPFADNPLTGFTPDGTQLVVVRRDVPPSGDRARFEVIRIDPAGDTLSHRSFRYIPEPLSSGYTDSVVNAHWESSGGDDALFTRRQLREAMYLPRYLPPVRDLLVGSDGELWLRRWSTEAGEQEWLVIGPHGSVEATVELPPRFSLRAAKADRLWGVQFDSLDVPYLVQYRLAVR